MILFFFLLLMLALAWGVADHYQSILRAEPPAQSPTIVAQPAAKAPAANEATTETASGGDIPAARQAEPWPAPLDAAGNPLNANAPDDKDAATK